MDYNKAALEMHETHKGKVGIVSKVEVATRDDLSTAYTPGVAEPCRKIKENPDDVYKYTFKGNMVAVVSNGTAVLGLGDIGPEAGLPVMEGKAVLFKEFGGVDAFPICIDAHDAASVIAACKAIAPTFGGINLEDIKSPECFEIGEIWGKATAQRVVKYGFIGQIFATACIMITGVFPATDAVMDNAYQTLLGQNWIFVIGSLSAYLVSQSWDVAVFHAIRDRYIAKHGSTKGGRWLWNNGSTITSQIWDTVIYAVISFGFGLGWVHTHEGRMQLIGIIIGQYLLKACLALLDTPFFYFFTRNADRR